jgi:WD40 repeat protein
VETLPRRGYRFVGLVVDGGAQTPNRSRLKTKPANTSRRLPLWLYGVLVLAVVSVATVVFFIQSKRQIPQPVKPRLLTRLTFDEGLQIGATWFPDGRFIAYNSDNGGKFDIWVQQVSSGDPVQITKGPGTNWQPDWSPDGKYIAYRSESGGGLFIIPALGGEALERTISSFGYYPHWSPDGSKILFGADLTPCRLKTGSTYWRWTEALHERYRPTLPPTFVRFRRPGSQMEREFLFYYLRGQLQAFGRFRLLGDLHPDWRLHRN